MGRIREPELIRLAEEWSPVVHELLDEMGQRVWPHKKIRRSLFSRPEIIVRYTIEGPVQRGSAIAWSLTHTSKPSAFDSSGVLSKGERQFWLVTIHPGTPPQFAVEGAQTQAQIPVGREALFQALQQARKDGPMVQEFYGNKGPLSYQ